MAEFAAAGASLSDDETESEEEEEGEQDAAQRQARRIVNTHHAQQERSTKRTYKSSFKKFKARALHAELACRVAWALHAGDQGLPHTAMPHAAADSRAPCMQAFCATIGADPEDFTLQNAIDYWVSVSEYLAAHPDDKDAVRCMAWGGAHQQDAWHEKGPLHGGCMA